MYPYRITSATLITYAGRRHTMAMTTEIFTDPVNKVKDCILDKICQMCAHRDDPFVKIEVRTKRI